MEPPLINNKRIRITACTLEQAGVCKEEDGYPHSKCQAGTRNNDI